MYNDPALPKTPPPPHAAPHTEAFTRTARQHHYSSRVGTVERPVEDSQTELQFHLHPRNIPVSEFLESLAPPEGPRPCRPPKDCTRRYFQTLSTFPFQPTDRSYPRWPDKPDAYLLFPRLEDPSLNSQFHKTPSRVGTVTRSCDERTRRRFPTPEERSWGTWRYENEKCNHPIATDLGFTPKECPIAAGRGRYASEGTFRTPKPCSWSSSEDESKVCFDGTIRCRRGDEYPVCCRPVGAISYSETQHAIPYARHPNRFGIHYEDIERDDQYQHDRRDRLQPQRPYSEKPILSTPQWYRPRGGSTRLSGNSSDEERFSGSRSRVSMVPQGGSSPYARKPERQQYQSRNSIDVPFPTSKFSEHYGARRQSQVGIPNRHFAEPSKTRRSSLNSYRRSTLKVNSNLSKIQDPRLIDKRSKGEKRSTAPHIEFHAENTDERGENHSGNFKEQQMRHASRIGGKPNQGPRGKQSIVTNLSPHRKSAEPRQHHFAGVKKRSIITARELGQSGGSAKKSRGSSVDRHSARQSRTHNDSMNGEQQYLENQPQRSQYLEEPR